VAGVSEQQAPAQGGGWSKERMANEESVFAALDNAAKDCSGPTARKSHVTFHSKNPMTPQTTPDPEMCSSDFKVRSSAVSNNRESSVHSIPSYVSDAPHELARWSVAGSSYQLSRYSLSSRTSGGITPAADKRGLFRFHVNGKTVTEEEKEELRKVGRCSLNTLVAKFKAPGHFVKKEPALEIPIDLGMGAKASEQSLSSPCSDLLWLDKPGQASDVIGIHAATRTRYSRFVQANYINYNVNVPRQSVLEKSGYSCSKQASMESQQLRQLFTLSNPKRLSSMMSYRVHARTREKLGSVVQSTSSYLCSLVIAATRPRKMARFIAASFVILMVLFLSIVVIGGDYFGDRFLVLHDPDLRGDPGYLVDFFGEKCIYLKRRFQQELKRLENSNRRTGWRTVTFNARDGRLVSALWLPSPVRQSPRVVIAHSGLSNYLDAAVQSAAYYLRSMNISVLAPNLRHHGGYGEFSRQVLRWRHQEQDLLGAWDYAVSDPQGSLGGPVEPGYVGLMGFDWGGLAVQLAFGLEPRISAIFLDGAVRNLRVLLRSKLQATVSSWLVWVWDEQAWTQWKDIVQRDLDKDITPERVVKHRFAAAAKPSAVGIVHSKEDTIVPWKFDDFFTNLPSISVMKWYPSFQGPSTCKKKSETYMDRPDEYKAFLCSFWSRSFDGSSKSQPAKIFFSFPQMPLQRTRLNENII
jgi:hypothetical protein